MNDRGALGIESGETNMNKNYEFGYQSTKQKLTLLGLKLLAAFFIGSNFYFLGWGDSKTVEKLNTICGILVGFWIYANLLRVKIEIQELFVPPIDIFHAKEFFLVSFTIGLGTMGYTIYQIYLLS